MREGFRHGLSFLATIAFVSSLIGSRTFATLNPQIVVIQQGIHFHHFWYGLALIAIAGWFGIARPSERLSRVYATVYGLGAGFIGDEVGLLLIKEHVKKRLEASDREFLFGADRVD